MFALKTDQTSNLIDKDMFECNTKMAELLD